MRRCWKHGPGSAARILRVENVLAVVKRIVAETCAIDPAKVRDESRLVEFGIDSVRAVDILVGLEHAFAIEIPDQDAAKLLSVTDLVRYVESKKKS